MLSNESQWLHNKKLSLLQQLVNLENQAEKICKDEAEKKQRLEERKRDLEMQYQSFKRQTEERQAKLKFQLAQVEEILQNKIVALDKEQYLTRQLENRLSMQKSHKADLIDSLEQKDRNIRKLQQQFQVYKIESQKLMNQKLMEQKNEVDSLINRYENLIQDRVFELQNSYQKQIQTIKINNQSLLSKIEHESERRISKNDEQFRVISKDHERILEENKRLLSSINQYKLKVINFETQVSGLTQDIKIVKKDSQYANINLKRQIDLLTSQNSQLQSKNRKLLDNIEELNWEGRQLRIKHSQDIKRIKHQTQKEISQCLENGMKSIKYLEKQGQRMKESIIELQDENLRKTKQIALLKDQLDRERKRVSIAEQENHQNFELARLGKEYHKQTIKKQQQIQSLHEQINRLKLKVNKITTAYHQTNKDKDTLEKQNKMLLSQIVFLRDKDKDRKKNQWSRVLDDVRSDVSRNEMHQNQEIQNYKHLIMEMQTEMHKALQKVQSKDRAIQKQKAIISRLQKALQEK